MYRERPTVVVRGRTVIAPVEVFAEPPRVLEFEGRTRDIIEWSGPWPIAERWWTGGDWRYRLQVIDTRGAAWALLSDGADWRIEARDD